MYGATHGSEFRMYTAMNTAAWYAPSLSLLFFIWRTLMCTYTHIPIYIYINIKMTDLMITMQSCTIKLALRLRRIITPTTHLVCSIAYHPAVDSFSFMVITGKMIANGSQPNRPPPFQPTAIWPLFNLAARRSQRRKQRNSNNKNGYCTANNFWQISKWKSQGNELH